MFWNLWSSMFKTFISRSVFGKLQLTHISLNFKASGWNFKIRGLEKKTCEGFVLLCFVFYLVIYNFVSLLYMREKQSLNLFARLYRHLWWVSRVCLKKKIFFKRRVSTIPWSFSSELISTKTSDIYINQINWLGHMLFT